MKRLFCLSCLLCFVLTQSAALAGDWRQFRGPNSNGTTDEKNLPVDWSKDGKIVWTAELPGPSAATPIVSGDHIFISSSNADKKSMLAMAFDRKSGKKLWEKHISDGLQRDTRSNYASNSPVADGEHAVFFYGTGTLVTFDYAGKQLWRREMAKDYGEFAFGWTFSTSPIIHGGKLYMQVLQRDTPVDGRGFKDKKNESYLLALDPKTGKQIWKVGRSSQARAESREAFTTPVIAKVDGKDQLLVIGGDDLTGHDPATGAELWRWGTWNHDRVGHWRHVPSPIIGKGIVLVCAPKRDPIYAIKPGKGKLSDDSIAWISKETRELSSDVPTPAFYDGDFFVLSDVRKNLARVDPLTGKTKWSVRTQGRSKYEASPTIADGKIWIINFHGEVDVHDAKTGELLATNKTDATREYPVRSSAVAAHGDIFVRTNRKLICVRKK